MGLRGPDAKPLLARHEALEATASRSYPWDALGLSRADRVIAFLEDLEITAGKHARTKLRLRQWQRRFVEAVYREDKRGIRPIRTAVLSMARKNGKSQLAAALALCHLCGPEAESRGEIYSCANDRFQAGRIFNEMVALISRHPALSARTNITSFRKEIHDLINGSIYVALTAEAKTKMGLSPSFVIYDELGSADGRALFDAMDSALGARENPLMLVISTQAADDFAPMSQLVDYGLRLEAGDIRDPAFHLTLYSAPEDADPWSKKAWRAANPALGDFRSLADVERLAKQAQRMPARENAFRNLILNQRVAAEARYGAPALVSQISPSARASVIQSLLKNKLRAIGWGQAERTASPISRGSTLIAMMQTAELREGNNVARGGKVYATRPWAVLVEREMRSGVMMILKIARQYAAQVTFIEDDNVIQTVAADRTMRRSA